MAFDRIRRRVCADLRSSRGELSRLCLRQLGMGYTDNPKTDADFTMDAITRHAFGFIQAVGIRRAILAGHSRGALPVASTNWI